MRRNGACFLPVLAMLLMAGCGSTWVDDAANFKRIYGFDKPNGVQVMPSYYWKAPKWRGTNYRYYIAQRGPVGFATDTAMGSAMMKREPSNSSARLGCGAAPPDWFVPKAPEQYDMWVSIFSPGIRVFKDKDDNTIFSCVRNP